MQSRLMVMSLAFMAACAPDAPVPAAEQGADSMPVALGTDATPHQARSPDPAGGDVMPDVGTGVLHLGGRPDSVRTTREDTVAIRAAPSDQAGIIARWIHTYGDDGTWEYRLETNEEQLLRNDIEWSYEANGLPVDTVAGGASWARVIHAMDDSGDPRFGWVRLTARTRIEPWTSVLAQQNLYFRSPDSLSFHDGPDGDTVAIEISAGDTRDGLDYTMRPLTSVDDWMRVIVTTPSDACVDAADAHADTVWIRYLDNEGRPRVWYYPRGC